MFDFFNPARTDFLLWGIRIFVLLFSLSFHEVAHGYIANKLGDPTARLSGRLTLNPLVHLDFTGTLMMLIGAPVAWAKPVPVNPSLFTKSKTMKRGMVTVAAAGPISNLILAFISSVLFEITSKIINISSVSEIKHYSPLFVWMVLLQVMFILNLNLAVFNLLPIPPLDGYKVMGAVLPNRLYMQIMKYERYIGMALLFLLIFKPRIISSVMQIARLPFMYLIQTPINFIFSLF